MKKFIYALLLGASLVNVSAASNKEVELDATIDEVSAQVDNSMVKRALTWMKAHKAATAAIGVAAIAGVAITADMVYHYAKYDKAANTVKFFSKNENKEVEHVDSWFSTTFTNKVKENVVDAAYSAKTKASEACDKATTFVKNHKTAVIASTIGLVAAVLVTADLTRGEKASLIRKLFAKKGANAEVVA